VRVLLMGLDVKTCLNSALSISSDISQSSNQILRYLQEVRRYQDMFLGAE